MYLPMFLELVNRLVRSGRQYMYIIYIPVFPRLVKGWGQG